MAHFEKYEVELDAATSAGATSATYYTPSMNGLIHSITYTTATSAFPTTSKISVISEGRPPTVVISSGQLLTGWTWYPRAAVQGSTGGDINLGTTGEGPVVNRIPLVNERLTISFIPGTTVGTGTFTFVVDGEVTKTV
jgi:hypothetical protein